MLNEAGDAATGTLSLDYTCLRCHEDQTTTWAAQTAGLTRRWEFSVGMPFETSLASTTYRECLPRGFLMFPGIGSQGEGQLQILVRNLVTAEDVFGPVTIRGHLLYP